MAKKRQGVVEYAGTYAMAVLVVGSLFFSMWQIGILAFSSKEEIAAEKAGYYTSVDYLANDVWERIDKSVLRCSTDDKWMKELKLEYHLEDLHISLSCPDQLGQCYETIKIIDKNAKPNAVVILQEKTDCGYSICDHHIEFSISPLDNVYGVELRSQEFKRLDKKCGLWKGTCQAVKYRSFQEVNPWCYRGMLGYEGNRSKTKAAKACTKDYHETWKYDVYYLEFNDQIYLREVEHHSRKRGVAEAEVETLHLYNGCESAR